MYQGSGFLRLSVLLLLLLLCYTECSLEFLCSVLAVAEQLLITRLKTICEVLIAQLCK